MSKSTNKSSSVINFVNLLAILFIGLKLTGYINWSWWWVLISLGLLIFGVIFIYLMIADN